MACNRKLDKAFSAATRNGVSANSTVSMQQLEEVIEKVKKELAQTSSPPPSNRNSYNNKFYTSLRRTKAFQVRQLHQAIQEKRKVQVKHGIGNYIAETTFIPLDLKRKKLPKYSPHGTGIDKMLILYEEQRQKLISIPFNRVTDITPIEETFEPATVAPIRNRKRWKLPRQW